MQPLLLPSPSGKIPSLSVPDWCAVAFVGSLADDGAENAQGRTADIIVPT